MGRPAPSRSRSQPLRTLVERLEQQLGDEVTGLEDALHAEPPVTVRINPAKWKGPDRPVVPWCASGRYLADRPSFTFDPLFHAGAYYVQEASSMLLEQAVKATGLQDTPIVALDLCAAPGGKTTHLRSLLHPETLLVANEIDRKRQPTLMENCWKWGAPNTVISGSAPVALRNTPECFDLILVDAPCSGEGMFRKDAYAREQWSPELVEACARTQSSILDHAWSALRPGGWLIYSTCTWELQENEQQLDRLTKQGAQAYPLQLDPAWGIVQGEHLGILGARCYPHRLRGEGLFCAVLRKPGAYVEPSELRIAEPQQDLADEQRYLLTPETWHTLEREEIRYAIRPGHARTIDTLERTLQVFAPGIPLVERKAGRWRPHPALALSTALDKDRCTTMPLDREQAIAYLKGATLPAQNASGTALATYADMGLGWLHGAGNRWNNRWPTPWRIRAHKPMAPPVSWADAGSDPA